MTDDSSSAIASEPLRRFDSTEPSLVEPMAVVDALHERYCSLRDAGRILANSVDAMRLELTYHSGAHRFPELLPALFELANRPDAHPRLHPVIHAAELHYNLVAIHPFTDGNGRIARLLMNLHLLRRGWPLLVIEVERRAEYLAALEAANAGHCEPFARFVLESAAASMGRLIGDESSE